MQKTIIIDELEYTCSDIATTASDSTLSDDDVIFEIVDMKGRMSYIIAGPTDLLGEPIKNIWFIETITKLEPDSIFPTDMIYDDEYYKSTYIPTLEEEEQASRLFNKNKD